VLIPSRFDLGNQHGVSMNSEARRALGQDCSRDRIPVYGRGDA